MEKTQKLTMDKDWHERLMLDFLSARVTDDETCIALKRINDTFDYVVDPHTAVALSAADKLGYPIFQNNKQDSMNPLVILSTASPCKFEHAVTVALGSDGWSKYMQNGFPARALKTMGMKEKEPLNFSWPEGSELSEVQAEWQKKMLLVVDENFPII